MTAFTALLTVSGANFISEAYNSIGIFESIVNFPFKVMEKWYGPLCLSTSEMHLNENNKTTKKTHRKAYKNLNEYGMNYVDNC